MAQDDTSQDSRWQGAGELWTALRRLLRVEVWLIASLIVGLVCVEVGLRWVRPDMAGLVYSARQTGGHPIVVTPEGLRTPPQGAATGSGPVVIGMGDSTTYGTGVAAEETWSLALDTVLSVPAVLRNGGFPGAPLQGIRHRYETLWAVRDTPAIVVLMVSANMISFTDFQWDAALEPVRARPFQSPQNGLKARMKQLVQSSALWKAVSVNVNTLKYATGLSNHRVDPVRPLSPLMAYGWLQPDLPRDAQDRMWQRFEAEMTQLRDDVRSQGGCLVVGFMPPRFMLSDQILDNLKFVPKNRMTQNAEARIRDLSVALDMPFIESVAALRDLRRTTSAFMEPLYIPDDYTHLSPQGHAEVAQSVAQVIAPLLEGTATCPGAD